MVKNVGEIRRSGWRITEEDYEKIISGDFDSCPHGVSSYVIAVPMNFSLGDVRPEEGKV